MAVDDKVTEAIVFYGVDNRGWEFMKSDYEIVTIDDFTELFRHLRDPEYRTRAVLVDEDAYGGLWDYVGNVGNRPLFLWYSSEEPFNSWRRVELDGWVKKTEPVMPILVMNQILEYVNKSTS